MMMAAALAIRDDAAGGPQRLRPAFELAPAGMARVAT